MCTYMKKIFFILKFFFYEIEFKKKLNIYKNYMKDKMIFIMSLGLFNIFLLLLFIIAQLCILV